MSHKLIKGSAENIGAVHAFREKLYTGRLDRRKNQQVARIQRSEIRGNESRNGKLSKKSDKVG